MRYFKEIETANISRTFLVRPYTEDHTIISSVLAEFYTKHQSVFRRINELSWHIDLVGISERTKELKTIDRATDDEDRHGKLEREIYGIQTRLLYTYGDDISYDSEYGLSRFFEHNNSDTVRNEFYTDKRDDVVRFELTDVSYDVVYNILEYYYKLLGYVNLSKDNLREDIGKALDDLDRYKASVRINRYQNIPLCDCWYIIPGFGGLDDALYNITDKYGCEGKPVDDIYEKILYSKVVYPLSHVEHYMDQVRKVSACDFVDWIKYNSTVNFGCVRLTSKVYDHTGIPFGLRKWFLDYKRGTTKSNIELIADNLVPKEKRDEFYELIEEKSKHFCILDHRNLPIGVYDILLKLLDYTSDAEWQKRLISQEALNRFAKTKKEFATMTPESYAARQCYGILKSIEIDLAAEGDRKLQDFELAPTLIYSEMARRLVIGWYMAYALVVKSFTELHNRIKSIYPDNASNIYLECLEYLKTLSRDECLVRFCGFNKVARHYEKGTCYQEIITSNVNYAEEFAEYYKHGWTVTFLPPIRFDEYSGNLRDMTDFCKVKRFHGQD